MPSFAVERYLPGSSDAERAAEIARIRAARDALCQLGVSHRSSMLVPADELCMHLFDAPRQADLIVAFRNLRLTYDRIVEVELDRP